MKKILLILSTALLAGCVPVSGQTGKAPSDNSPDVYIAGYDVDTQNVLVAALWKNGVMQKLTDGLVVDYENGYSISASANDVAVSGGDVYVAGFENEVARLWKNGVLQELTVDTGRPSSATAIYISAGDVYVAGSKTWKNGHVLYAHESGYGNSVFVSEGDVYVASRVDHDAVLWKNGVAHELPGREGGGDATANSVYVSAGDVYVAGWKGFFHDNGTAYLMAVLWKNGEEMPLTGMSDGEAEANSVFVSDANVYVAGRVDNYAVFWKNGVMQKLTDGNCQAIANSVCVSDGGDVYVAGFENGIARLWINGVVQNFIAGGSKSSSAYSVFVK